MIWEGISKWEVGKSGWKHCQKKNSLDTVIRPTTLNTQVLGPKLALKKTHKEQDTDEQNEAR